MRCLLPFLLSYGFPVGGFRPEFPRLFVKSVFSTGDPSSDLGQEKMNGLTRSKMHLQLQAFALRPIWTSP